MNSSFAGSFKSTNSADAQRKPDRALIESHVRRLRAQLEEVEDDRNAALRATDGGFRITSGVGRLFGLAWALILLAGGSLALRVTFGLDRFLFVVLWFGTLMGLLAYGFYRLFRQDERDVVQAAYAKQVDRIRLELESYQAFLEQHHHELPGT